MWLEIEQLPFVYTVTTSYLRIGNCWSLVTAMKSVPVDFEMKCEY